MHNTSIVHTQDGHPDTWEQQKDIADNVLRDFEEKWWTAARTVCFVVDVDVGCCVGMGGCWDGWVLGWVGVGMHALLRAQHMNNQ